MNGGISFGGGNEGVAQVGNNNVGIAGQHNRVQAAVAPLAGAETAADMVELVREMRALLVPAAGDQQAKITTRLDEIDAELAKPEPDKREIAETLDQVLRAVQKTNAIAAEGGKLLPLITRATTWLGDQGSHLLGYFSDGPPSGV